MARREDGKRGRRRWRLRGIGGIESRRCGTSGNRPDVPQAWPSIPRRARHAQHANIPGPRLGRVPRRGRVANQQAAGRGLDARKRRPRYERRPRSHTGAARGRQESRVDSGGRPVFGISSYQPGPASSRRASERAPAAARCCAQPSPSLALGPGPAGSASPNLGGRRRRGRGGGPGAGGRGVAAALPHWDSAGHGPHWSALGPQRASERAGDAETGCGSARLAARRHRSGSRRRRRPEAKAKVEAGRGRASRARPAGGSTLRPTLDARRSTIDARRSRLDARHPTLQPAPRPLGCHLPPATADLSRGVDRRPRPLQARHGFRVAGWPAEINNARMVGPALVRTATAASVARCLRPGRCRRLPEAPRRLAAAGRPKKSCPLRAAAAAAHAHAHAHAQAPGRPSPLVTCRALRCPPPARG